MCAMIVAALLFGAAMVAIAVGGSREARAHEEPEAECVALDERPRQHARARRDELLRHARRFRTTSRAPRPRIERRLTMETRT